MSSTRDRLPRDTSAARELSTIDRLKESYGDKELADRADSFVSRFLYRPISFYLTVPFVYMGWSANQVTLLRAVLALFSAALVTFGYRGLVVLGGSMYAGCVLLDYVDGNLARLQGTNNNCGAWLEELADQVGPSLFPLAIGVGLYFRPDRLLRLLGAVHPVGALLAGALTSLSYCLGVVARLYILLTPVDARKQVSATARLSSPAPHASVLMKALNVGTLVINEGLYLAIVLGVVLAAVFDVMSIYLAARAIRNVALLVVWTWRLAERLVTLTVETRH